MHALEADAPGPRRLDAAIALVFALALVAFAAVSWGKWPLLTADSARELYVPFQIRHGALIYRDFAYLYGPVAPYLQAGLLALFGEHLAVLYAASLVSLAATMALLYTLARQVLAPGPAAAVLWIFFTHFALGRDIWGYVWPYAFAATYGVLWGLVLLVALARHARTGGRGWLVLAGVAAGLSLVTKLEYGFAAVATAAVYGGLHALARPGVRRWLADALALLLPAGAVAGAIAASVLARVPWPVVRASVWPTALMKLWDSQGTWHGTPSSWLWNLEWLALALGVMAVAHAHGALAGAVRRGDPRGWAAVGAIALAALALATRGRFFVLHAPEYWVGPGFLVLFGLLFAAGRRLATGARPSPALATWVLVGAYGCLVATRTLMHGYNEYTRYQAPVTLVAWVGLAAVWLPAWLAGRGIAPRAWGSAALAGVVLVCGGRLAGTELASYMQPHEAVSGPAGTVWADPAFARPYRAALDYVRARTHPGDAIVAAPMEASFYLFTGLDNVLHEDQLFWGYLTTHDEQAAAIRRMEDRRVRYFVLSSYGERLHAFGRDYMPELGDWLARRCRLVGDYGGPDYRVRVYATPYAPEAALAAARRPRAGM